MYLLCQRKTTDLLCQRKMPFEWVPELVDKLYRLVRDHPVLSEVKRPESVKKIIKEKTTCDGAILRIVRIKMSRDNWPFHCSICCKTGDRMTCNGACAWFVWICFYISGNGSQTSLGPTYTNTAIENNVKIINNCYRIVTRITKLPGAEAHGYNSTVQYIQQHM